MNLMELNELNALPLEDENLTDLEESLLQR